MASPEREKQILVAGVGNAFLSDDGFGGAVARGLERRAAADRGDGDGLRHRRPRPRLRGDARVRRAGHRRRQPPGRRARDALRDGARRGRGRGWDRGRRGDQPARDGPEDDAALRQIGRRLAGQGRGRRLRAGRRRGDGHGAEQGRRRRGRARRRHACSSRSPSCSRTPPTRDERVHELSLSSAILETVLRHGERPQGQLGADADRGDAPGRAGVARLLLRDRHPRDPRRGGACWSRSTSPRCCTARTARPSGARSCRRSAAPDAAAPRSRSWAGMEFEIESIMVEEKEEAGCIAPR